MSPPTGFVIGYPWYTAEDYEAVRAVMIDGETMPALFAEWEAVVTEIERKTSANGSTVIRVFIKPMEFALWCESNSMVPDAKARNAYASSLSQKNREGGEE